MKARKRFPMPLADQFHVPAGRPIRSGDPFSRGTSEECSLETFRPVPTPKIDSSVV